MALTLFPGYNWDRHRPNIQQLDKGLFERFKKKSKYTLTARVGVTVVDLLRHIPGFGLSAAIVTPFLKSNKEIKAVLLFGALSLGVSRASLGLCHLFQKLDEGEGKAVGNGLRYAEKVAFFISKAAISFFYFWTTTRLMHELGHAIFAGALFQNSFPRIELTLTSQKTVYFPQSLTPLGAKVGWKHSLLLYTAGGLIFDLVHDLFTLTFGHFSKDPHIAIEAQILVAMNTLKNTAYAVGALWFEGKKVSHDFVQLQQFGKIDPLIAAIGILAIPIVWKIALKTYEDLSSKVNKLIAPPSSLVMPVMPPLLNTRIAQLTRGSAGPSTPTSAVGSPHALDASWTEVPNS